MQEDSGNVTASGRSVTITLTKEVASTISGPQYDYTITTASNGAAGECVFEIVSWGGYCKCVGLNDPANDIWRADRCVVDLDRRALARPDSLTRATRFVRSPGAGMLSRRTRIYGPGLALGGL